MKVHIAYIRTRDSQGFDLDGAKAFSTEEWANQYREALMKEDDVVEVLILELDVDGWFKPCACPKCNSTSIYTQCDRKTGLQSIYCRSCLYKMDLDVKAPCKFMDIINEWNRRVRE